MHHYIRRLSEELQECINLHAMIQRAFSHLYWSIVDTSTGMNGTWRVQVLHWNQDNHGAFWYSFRHEDVSISMDEYNQVSPPYFSLSVWGYRLLSGHGCQVYMTGMTPQRDIYSPASVWDPEWEDQDKCVSWSGAINDRWWIDITRDNTWSGVLG